MIRYKKSFLSTHPIFCLKKIRLVFYLQLHCSGRIQNDILRGDKKSLPLFLRNFNKRSHQKRKQIDKNIIKGNKNNKCTGMYLLGPILILKFIK